MKGIKAPRPVVIAVLTLLTVVFWIVFGVIRIIVKPEDVNVPDEVIAPLDPTLNTQILDNLDQRIFLTDDEIGEIVIASAEPTTIPEATSSATPEASASPSPTASPTPETAPSPTP